MRLLKLFKNYTIILKLLCHKNPFIEIIKTKQKHPKDKIHNVVEERKRSRHKRNQRSSEKHKDAKFSACNPTNHCPPAFHGYHMPPPISRPAQQFHHQPQAQMKTCNGCGSWGVILCYILLSVMVVTASAQDRIVQRLNYGVIFKEISSIQMGQEYWTHTFELELPKQVTMPPFARCHTMKTSKCDILNRLIDQINIFKLQVASKINHSAKIIHDLIPNTHGDLLASTNSRRKRGLFDFIGTISKSLFGTATTEDINNLARHMNVISRNSNKLANAMVHQEKQFHSFMINSDKRFNNIMSSVKDNFKYIQNVTNDFNFALTNFENTIYYMLNETFKQTKFRKHSTMLILEITTGASCVMIPIVELPLCPKNWDIIAPGTINDLRVTGCFLNHLHVYWPDFTVINYRTKQEIPAPELIVLDPFTGRKFFLSAYYFLSKSVDFDQNN
ncbi:hypothetical protein KUTeg_018207 [Tegillarca granosa]|uniref:Uncharacterized protein n=1 Tax=Tegillarca granosa TaxID=220873 RepID=A0ABQ9EH45_TEGGR|nr:hypothetical protein KUTeg_018207 [Tegillarca granosa]